MTTDPHSDQRQSETSRGPDRSTPPTPTAPGRPAVSPRRERQLTQIAALVAAGEQARAVDLAAEHITTFPTDSALLALMGVGRAS